VIHQENSEQRATFEVLANPTGSTQDIYDRFVGVFEYMTKSNSNDTTNPKGVYEFRHIMKTMLRNPDMANARGFDGATALHWSAAGYYMMEFTEYLIEKGADVNAQDDAGKTPIMYSILHSNHASNYTETLKILLENGADISIKDNLDRDTRYVLLEQGQNSCEFDSVIFPNPSLVDYSTRNKKTGDNFAHAFAKSKTYMTNDHYKVLLSDKMIPYLLMENKRGVAPISEFIGLADARLNKFANNEYEYDSWAEKAVEQLWHYRELMQSLVNSSQEIDERILAQVRDTILRINYMFSTRQNSETVQLLLQNKNNRK